MNPKRLWQRIQQGHFHNIDFADFCRLIEAFGFELDRQEGSHRVYAQDAVKELVNVSTIGARARRYWSMSDYAIDIFWSEDDGEYIGVVPDLKGCSASGETPQEALEEVLIAERLWLEAAASRGYAIPKPHYRPPHVAEQAAG